MQKHQYMPRISIDDLSSGDVQSNSQGPFNNRKMQKIIINEKCNKGKITMVCFIFNSMEGYKGQREERRSGGREGGKEDQSVTLKKLFLKQILRSMSQIIRSLILAQGYCEFLRRLYSHGEVWVAHASFSSCITLSLLHFYPQHLPMHQQRQMFKASFPDHIGL